MASKRRIRRKACEGKKCFDSQLSASRVTSRFRKQNEWLMTYKCKFCHNWHIGHPNAKQKQGFAASHRREYGG